METKPGEAEPGGAAEGGAGDLDLLEERLGYRFVDRGLLDIALTHCSAAHERGSDAHYERLEFLGDAVLGLLAAEWLYEGLPKDPEGELSRRKSHLVSAPVLAEHARRLEIGELLHLGVGEERSGGREKPSLLADAMEALIGALYLDGGLEAVRGPVEELLEAAEGGEPGRLAVDPKSLLQERVQGWGWELPEYRLVETHGPDHDKRFVVECWLGDRCRGSGEGASKKRAEQRSASAALAALAGAGE